MQLISKDDLDEVQLWMFEKRFTRHGWSRFVIGPTIGILLLAMLARGGGAWRLWMLVATAVLIAWRILVAHRSRARRALTERMVKEKLWAPVVVGALLLVTGALDSPMLPMLALVCFVYGSMAPARGLVPFVLISVTVLTFLALASGLGFIPELMPTIFGGGSRSPQPDTLLWWKAGGMVFAMLWAAMVASNVRQVYRQIAIDAIDARDEILRSHDAHTREMTALTGELAHELKNPLANMKGLAVLIGRDVHGKAAERLAVLQGEIDRLGGILHGFLTFSRPLLPLNQEQVELGGLCDTVVALHEGMAHAEGVTLVIRPTPDSTGLHASCDPRKVKQILINLVQNALEASPRGSEVELVPLAEPGGGARVEVRDRGPGIASVMRAHLFEPGMSTKERGSGLGLALARALARQHGGDVALVDREGGGSVAALVLPRVRGGAA